MGRPKKGAIRKPLAKKDTNVPPEVIILDEEEEKAKADHEERMRIVKLVCEACDREVESRAAAIRALKDGHIASITGQLTLQQSKYPSHIRKMPMMQFLKEYCPNTEATTRPDGTIQLNIIHDKAYLLGGSQAQGGQMGAGASVENTPGFCVPRTSQKEQLMQSISKQLAGQKRNNDLSWEEFLVKYRMETGAKLPSSLETPSLRGPAMGWETNLTSQHMTPMTECFTSMLQPVPDGVHQGARASQVSRDADGFQQGATKSKVSREL
ncbi:unnamed protein product [Sphagnum compactum]